MPPPKLPLTAILSLTQLDPLLPFLSDLSLAMSVPPSTIRKSFCVQTKSVRELGRADRKSELRIQRWGQEPYIFDTKTFTQRTITARRPGTSIQMGRLSLDRLSDRSRFGLRQGSTECLSY